MRIRSRAWISLGLMICGGSLWAQVEVGRPDNIPEGGCRLTADDMVPLVGIENPFFFDHRWDNQAKTESGYLSPERHVHIKQHGCLRHHREITYSILPAACRPGDKNFYAVELLNLMNRLFYNSDEYWRMKRAFEQAFIRKFAVAGLFTPFNFQLNEYTFLCEFEYDDRTGAVLKLEMINLVNQFKMKKKGVPEYKDDGWYIPPRQ